MPTTQENSTSATVLLVHGVGDTTPGSVMDPAVLQIGKQLDGMTQTTRQEMPSNAPEIKLLSQTLRWNRFQLDLIEFHWSGVAGKIQRTTVFSSFKYLVSMLWSLPRLGAWGSQSRFRHAFASVFGGYQVFSLFVIMILSLWIMGADLFDYLDPDNFNLESLDVVFEVLLLGVLLPALTVSAVLYLLNRKITQWSAQWFGVVLGNLMLFYIWILLMISFAVVLVTVDEIVDVDRDVVSVVALVFIPLAIFPFYVVVRLLAFAADLFRDVIHYLAVDNQGNEHQDTVTIKSQLHVVLDDAIQAGATHIVIVAHSLGTAITAEILLERTTRTGQQHVTYEFVTCGSPLKRSLHRLLPQRIPHPDELFDKLKSQSAFNFGRWINIYRIADYVGKSLSGRKRSDESDKDTGDFHGIKDIQIEPSSQGPYSHSNYWGDARFLNILIEHFLASGASRGGANEAESAIVRR